MSEADWRHLEYWARYLDELVAARVGIKPFALLPRPARLVAALMIVGLGSLCCDVFRPRRRDRRQK